jgi:hypothetical protein
MLAEDGCPWCGPDDTIPAPPPDGPSLPDMVKAELERLRLQVSVKERSMAALRARIEKLERQ